MINSKEKFKKLFPDSKSPGSKPHRSKPAPQNNASQGSEEWEIMEFIREKRRHNSFNDSFYSTGPSPESLYQGQSYNPTYISSQKHTGIDRVKIYTNNYLIKDTEKLIEHSKSTNTKQIKDGLTVKTSFDNGTRVRRLYHEPDATGITWINLHRDYMSLVVNLPKVLTGNNLREIRTPIQLAKALESVYKTLEKEYHILFSPMDALVSEIEITRTEEMPRLCYNYEPVISRFKVPYMDWKPHYNGNITYANDQHSLVFYDKKLKQHGQPSHLLRIEYTLKNKDKINSVIDNKSNNKLTFLNIFENWEGTINKPYKDLINTMIQESEGTKVKKGTSTIDGLRQAYYAAEQDGRSAPGKVLMAVGLHHLEKRHIDFLSDLISEDKSPQSAYHFRENTVKNNQPYADAFKDVPLSELRQEIADAFTK